MVVARGLEHVALRSDMRAVRAWQAVTMSGVTCATTGGITHVIENGTRSLDVAHGSEVCAHVSVRACVDGVGWRACTGTPNGSDPLVPVPVQMWQGVSPVPAQMWQR